MLTAQKPMKIIIYDDSPVAVEDMIATLSAWPAPPLEVIYYDHTFEGCEANVATQIDEDAKGDIYLVDGYFPDKSGRLVLLGYKIIECLLARDKKAVIGLISNTLGPMNGIPAFRYKASMREPWVQKEFVAFFTQLLGANK